MKCWLKDQKWIKSIIKIDGFSCFQFILTKFDLLCPILMDFDPFLNDFEWFNWIQMGFNWICCNDLIGFQEIGSKMWIKSQFDNISWNFYLSRFTPLSLELNPPLRDPALFPTLIQIDTIWFIKKRKIELMIELIFSIKQVQEIFDFYKQSLKWLLHPPIHQQTFMKKPVQNQCSIS